MAYLLDSNVFIQAKNLHYGLDFCPACWDWLIAGNRDDAFFLKPDQSILPSLASVSVWATSQQYVPAAVSTFFNWPTIMSWRRRTLAATPSSPTKFRPARRGESRSRTPASA
jgi:hypothetical protein